MKRIQFSIFIIVTAFGCARVEAKFVEDETPNFVELVSLNEPELICEFIGQKALPSIILNGYCMSNIVILTACDKMFKECTKTKPISKCNKERDRCVDNGTGRGSDVIRYDEKQCAEKCSFLPYPLDCIQQKIDNPKFICMEARRYCMSMCENGYM